VAEIDRNLQEERTEDVKAAFQAELAKFVEDRQKAAAAKGEVAEDTDKASGDAEETADDD
jgi:hypothetical protein